MTIVWNDDAGYTLIELIVASALLIMLSALTCAIRRRSDTGPST